ncbi:MAG: pilus assembly protein TadG-related protein, partial [Blastocatellia bacterium]
ARASILTTLTKTDNQKINVEYSAARFSHTHGATGKGEELMKIDRKQNGKWSSERGSILAVSTIGMVALLLAVGLAVDISHLYLVGTELQNAADAAALAGASALNSEASGIKMATDRAIEKMNKYEFNGIDVTIGRTDVRFAVNLSEFDPGGSGGKTETDGGLDPANVRFVQVTVPPKAVNIFFAKLASGSNTVDLTRRAVAGQSAALNLICNVVPLSVVEGNNGAPLNSPDCPGLPNFQSKCTYVLRLGPNGGGNGKGKGDGDSSSGSVSPGNYLILAFDGNSGGSDVKYNLALASNKCYQVGTDVPVSTEPGIKGGPVRFGLNTRFDDYGGGFKDSDAATYPPDTNVKQNITHTQYSAAQSQESPPPEIMQAPTHTGVANRRILIVPIIQQSEYDNGRDSVHISKFGAFFMKEQVAGGNGNDITAEYVGNITLGSGGVIGNTPGNNPSLTVAVLYR